MTSRLRSASHSIRVPSCPFVVHRIASATLHRPPSESVFIRVHQWLKNSVIHPFVCFVVQPNPWRFDTAALVHPWSTSFLLLFTLFISASSSSASDSSDSPATPPNSAASPTHEICVIVGAPGEPAFAAGFAHAALAWKNAATRAGASFTLIGIEEPPASTSSPSPNSTSTAPIPPPASTPNLRPPTNANVPAPASVPNSTSNPTPTSASSPISDRDRLHHWIASRAGTPDSDAPLWIVYLGHGTFDRREARLNLRGTDLTAKDLATWLAPVTRPLIFIHGGSASTPFIPALSAPNRIIISATRSGHELNYARFGERFADAIANPDADIDRDGQTSVLESFVTASQQVQSFYTETGRLATEHALIDDNGDRQGTPAEWYRGLRLQRRVEGPAEPDGARAKLIALIPSSDERALTATQREQRDALERELETLRTRKSELSEADYYRQLEILFRQLGSLYRRDT